MYCTKCGVELHEFDNFCSRCGAPSALCPAPEIPRTLMLDKRNKKISGVCAGFARYFGMDIVLMRVLWLVFAIGTGVGFLVYLAAWIALPSDTGYEAQNMMMQIPQRR